MFSIVKPLVSINNGVSLYLLIQDLLFQWIQCGRIDTTTHKSHRYIGTKPQARLSTSKRLVSYGLVERYFRLVEIDSNTCSTLAQGRIYGKAGCMIDFRNIIKISFRVL